MSLQTNEPSEWLKNECEIIMDNCKYFEYGDIDNKKYEDTCKRAKYPDKTYDFDGKTYTLFHISFINKYGRFPNCEHLSHICGVPKSKKRKITKHKQNKRGTCINGDHLNEETLLQNQKRRVHHNIISLFVEKIYRLRPKNQKKPGPIYISDITLDELRLLFPPPKETEKYIKTRSQKKASKRIYAESIKCECKPLCFINYNLSS